MASGYTLKRGAFFGGNWNRIKSQPRDYYVFEEYAEEDSGNLFITTPNGAFVGNIAITARDTIFTEGTFITTPNGSESFTFKLNDLPNFPILRFSKIVLRLGGNRIFSGYIYDTPEQGTKRKKYYEFKGFGTAKRLESQVIVNNLKQDISSIAISGSYERIYLTSPLMAGIGINQWAIVRRAQNDSNNVAGFITATGTNWVEILNPAAATQSIAIGQLVVLPEEWSGFSTVLVSELFEQIVSTYTDGLNINYVPSLIQSTPGYTTGGGRIDFDGLTLKKVFDTIKLMLGEAYDLGVDETDSFFLRPKETDTLGQFHVGYQVQEPNISLRTNEIVNFVKIMSGKAKNESTTVGTSVRATAQDLTSQKKYGLFSKDIEVPGYLSDEVCQLVADTTILNKKEPKYSIQLKDLDLKYYPHGYYNTVSEQDEWIFDTDDMESLTGWSANPSGATKSLNSDILLSGAYSTKFALTTSANGNSIYKDVDYKLSFGRQLIVWIYQTVSYQVLEFGFGVTSYTENLQKIYPPASNAYFPVMIDISNLGIQSIGQIGLNFQNLLINTDVYIDRLQLIDYGSLRYNMYTRKITYKFLTRKSVVDMDMGDDNPRNMEDFLSGIKAQTETSKILLKDY